MIAGTFVSRGLGFVKAILLVAAIGGTSAGVGGQVFDVANSLPTNLYTLIAGGVLASILVPQIVRALADHSDGGTDYLSRLLSLVVFGGALVTAVLVFFAPILVRLYAGSWSEDWLHLATNMAYWCLPQVFFLIVYTVLGQILNARGEFGWYMWAPALSNVIAILGIIAFLIVVPDGLVSASEWTPGMVTLIAGAATAGTVAQAALLLWPLSKTGLKFRPRIGVAGLGGLGTTATWSFLGLLAWQSSYLFISNAGTAAGQALQLSGQNGASLNSLSNAYLILLIPHGLIAVSLVTAVYTRVSEEAHRKEFGEVKRQFMSTAAILSYVSTLSACVFLFLGPLIGLSIWGAEPIGQVLAILAIGLTPYTLTYLMQRMSYAVHDARSPFIVQLVVAVITTVGTIASSIFLVPNLVVLGIAASISLANIIGSCVAIVLLRRSYRRHGVLTLGIKNIVIANLKYGVTGVVAGGAGWAIATALPLPGTGQISDLIRVGVGAGLTLGLFVAICRLRGDETLGRLLPR